MKYQNELKVDVSGIKGKIKQKKSSSIDCDLNLANEKRQKKKCPSSISLIVSNLLAESYQDEMLGKLKLKLGKTKEEIQKIISEL